MGSKYTKRYTEEFKRDAIVLVDSSGKTVTAVARELGISSESLRGRHRWAKTDRGESESGELTSTGREELKPYDARQATDQAERRARAQAQPSVPPICHTLHRPTYGAPS
ncbi:transposase [Streptomyces sp. NPDC005989]|uniref:transposase n=1 Tax=unclassified Streptomyces TaxID=2593676 RepID=UPI0033C28C2D